MTFSASFEVRFGFRDAYATELAPCFEFSETFMVIEALNGNLDAIFIITLILGFL